MTRFRLRHSASPCTLSRFRRDDLVDTVIGPVAAEAAAGSLTDLKEDTARVAKYLQRYQEVQRHRLNMQVDFLCALAVLRHRQMLWRAVQQRVIETQFCCSTASWSVAWGSWQQESRLRDDSWLAWVQAALAEADELAGPSPERDVDEASEAGSMVSGMSAYTTASTTAGSTVTGSGRPASTVGGRKPHKQKNRQKVRQQETRLCKRMSMRVHSGFFRVSSKSGPMSGAIAVQVKIVSFVNRGEPGSQNAASAVVFLSLSRSTVS